MYLLEKYKFYNTDKPEPLCGVKKKLFFKNHQFNLNLCVVIMLQWMESMGLHGIKSFYADATIKSKVLDRVEAATISYRCYLVTFN